MVLKKAACAAFFVDCTIINPYINERFRTSRRPGTICRQNTPTRPGHIMKTFRGNPACLFVTYTLVFRVGYPAKRFQTSRAPCKKYL